MARDGTARDRDTTATGRDRIADERDGAGLARDARAIELQTASGPETAVMVHLRQLANEAAADRAHAADDRAHAAADRARAALDRAGAAREWGRLEAELRLAHLDHLTGAYRREMGPLTLSHEIDRARRSDGRFVVAFVDVDGLKTVNDRDGHAAGDRVLETLVRVIRSQLRSFDPIIRYGGDEFVCGIGGSEVEEVQRRFEAISASIEQEVGVSISVGLATLTSTDDPDQLTHRADTAMLEGRRKPRARR